VTHNGPEVLFKTCVAMKFVDDDDDDSIFTVKPVFSRALYFVNFAKITGRENLNTVSF